MLASQSFSIKIFIAGYGNQTGGVKVGYDDFERYGSFNTYDEALSKRNELLSSNWVVEENSEEKVEVFIYQRDDGKYYVKNEIDGVMRIFGVFDDFIEAISFRINCVKANWELPSEIDTLSQNDSSDEEDLDIIFEEEINKQYLIFDDKNTVKSNRFNI